MSKTVGELRREMSLHELATIWPAYYATVARREAAAALERQRQAERERRRI